MYLLIRASFRLEPSPTVCWKMVLMKSSQAGGRSTSRKSRKLRYCMASNMAVIDPVKEGI